MAATAEKQSLVYSEEIPKVDFYDTPYKGFLINRDHYGPGKHLVTQDVADEISRVLKVWRYEQMRLLRPKSDPRVTSRLDPTNNGS